ncbi:filamentous hemagglutinin N-terminal domain-containing protein [Vibrio panuliri]|uniref:Filamentous haemagglutinin FhaB/tRNA nuclease CdiA-like TPS domain-containing protein n=1 Tax=Vibrio panuliri TaxID=1381081 RepID=A0ABX3F464_9VIBR|nr:filamentous hemagglutinin N-terminal domain-containing protein [Vibrio panuliri]KAB1457267.1 filamentous hemagglutinin N-terminal domain-containing protein [Vibrio panuliri]OLQ84734.1 hypothetical protein BIY20_17095 [Vibrio panuliri]
MKINSIYLSIAVTVASFRAFALPNASPTIVSGDGQVTTTGSSMLINHTANKSILNWKSFNIGVGESVNVTMPNAASALYRVSGSATNIFGQLNVPNGQLYVVNPAGITLGDGSVIRGANVTLSTSSITDGDFISGNLNATAKGVINIHDTVNLDGVVTLKGSRIIVGAGLETPGHIVGKNGSTIHLLGNDYVWLYPNSTIKAVDSGDIDVNIISSNDDPNFNARAVFQNGAMLDAGQGKVEIRATQSLIGRYDGSSKTVTLKGGLLSILGSTRGVSLYNPIITAKNLHIEGNTSLGENGLPGDGIFIAGGQVEFNVENGEVIGRDLREGTNLQTAGIRIITNGETSLDPSFKPKFKINGHVRFEGSGISNSGLVFYNRMNKSDRPAITFEVTPGSTLTMLGHATGVSGGAYGASAVSGISTLGFFGAPSFMFDNQGSIALEGDTDSPEGIGVNFKEPSSNDGGPSNVYIASSEGSNFTINGKAPVLSGIALNTETFDTSKNKGSVALTGESNKGDGILVEGGSTTLSNITLKGNSVSGNGVSIQSVIKGDNLNVAGISTSGAGITVDKGVTTSGNSSFSGQSVSGKGVNISEKIISTGDIGISGRSTSGFGVSVGGSIESTDNVNIVGSSFSGDGLNVEKGGKITSSNNLNLGGVSKLGNGVSLSGDVKSENLSVTADTDSGVALVATGNIQSAQQQINVVAGAKGKSTAISGTGFDTSSINITRDDGIPLSLKNDVEMAINDSITAMSSNPSISLNQLRCTSKEECASIKYRK